MNSMHIYANTLLCVIVGMLVVSGIHEFKMTSTEYKDDSHDRWEKMRKLGASISSTGILLWPIIWDTLIGYDMITRHPLLLFGFVWPMAMGSIDLITSTKKNCFADKDSSNSPGAGQIFNLHQISLDSNTLVGITFAVATFLTVQKNNSKAIEATIPLLMYSLLLLIAFIIPTPNLDPNDYPGFCAGAIQRTFFNYAMGFVITGITLNVSMTKKPANHPV